MICDNTMQPFFPISRALKMQSLPYLDWAVEQQLRWFQTEVTVYQPTYKFPVFHFSSISDHGLAHSRKHVLPFGGSFPVEELIYEWSTKQIQFSLIAQDTHFFPCKARVVLSASGNSLKMLH